MNTYAKPAWTLAALTLTLACATTPSSEAETSSSTGDESSTESETGYASPEDHGAALYDTYCAFCHGAEGEGYVADNATALANQEFLRIASDAFLASSIRYGRPGTSMSAWGEVKAGPLSDEEIEHIIAFMRTWQSVESVDPSDYVIDADSSTIRGETYYEVFGCVDCHGPLGFGGEYVTLENPWFLTQVSDGYLRDSIARGRPGTPMPAFVGGEPELTVAQIDDLIMLIRSWEREVDSDPLPPFDPDISDAVINPDGPDPEFELELSEGRFIGVDPVNAALEAGAKLIILDARPHADYVDSHIAGAVSIPFFDLDKVIDELPQDVWIVNYCGCPHAISGQSFDALEAAGFTKIAVLDEGFYEWVERGYPIESGE